MRRALFAVALVSALATPTSIHAWGYDAHKFIVERAIPLLPDALRPLFEANRSIVVEHCDRSRLVARPVRRAGGSASLSRLRLGGVRTVPVCRPAEESRRRGEEVRESSSRSQRDAAMAYRGDLRQVEGCLYAHIRGAALSGASTSCSTPRGWGTTSATRTFRFMPWSIRTASERASAASTPASRPCSSSATSNS